MVKSIKTIQAILENQEILLNKAVLVGKAFKYLASKQDKADGSVSAYAKFTADQGGLQTWFIAPKPKLKGLDHGPDGFYKATIESIAKGRFDTADYLLYVTPTKGLNKMKARPSYVKSLSKEAIKKLKYEGGKIKTSWEKFPYVNKQHHKNDLQQQISPIMRNIRRSIAVELNQEELSKADGYTINPKAEPVSKLDKAVKDTAPKNDTERCEGSLNDLQTKVQNSKDLKNKIEMLVLIQKMRILFR